jgi:hypothetical protein
MYDGAQNVKTYATAIQTRRDVVKTDSVVLAGGSGRSGSALRALSISPGPKTLVGWLEFGRGPLRGA